MRQRLINNSLIGHPKYGRFAQSVVDFHSESTDLFLPVCCIHWVTFSVVYLLSILFTVFFLGGGGVPFLTMAASGKESWKNIGDVKGICFSFYAVYLLNVFPCILCDGKGEECYRQTEIKKGGWKDGFLVWIHSLVFEPARLFLNI